MSQDFQDLSGQVINKVMKMLERMEKPLHHVLVTSPSPAPPPRPKSWPGCKRPTRRCSRTTWTTSCRRSASDYQLSGLSR